MGRPVSHNVSVYRGTQDTPLWFTYIYGTLTLYGWPSQIILLLLLNQLWSPTTPIAVATGLGYSAFARHYSQNLLFSSPYLDVSVQAVPYPYGLTRFEPCRVSPFRYLRFLRFYTPHRSFSQCNTSFFGTRCLGIHYAPFVTFRNLWYGVADLLGCVIFFFCITCLVDYLIVKTHFLLRVIHPLLSTKSQNLINTNR